jgi:protein O-GlcNAc transferase
VTGRNDPCPCGSGKKFKKCCIGKQAPDTVPAAATLSPTQRLDMARAALRQRNFRLAREQLSPLLRSKSVDASTWALAGGIEMQDKQFEAAKECFESALQIEPDNAVFLYNYGTVLAQTGGKERALEMFRRSLAINPGFYQAANNLGNTLRDLGRIDEAVECYREVFRQPVRDLGILSQILLSMQFFCEDNHEELYQLHCELGARIASRIPADTPRRIPQAGEARGKIRLGYLSPRFSREIVSYFFKPIFDHHDRDRFELYLYSATARQDEMTAYFARNADKWTDTTPLSDTALCQRIVDEEIDILIDLAGHAPENRITVTARKPAPVQVSMLDYFDTTGVPAVDYYVSDAFSTPPDTRQKFSEALLLLDQFRLVYEAPDYAPPVRLREPAGDEIVFGSFNRPQKIVSGVIRVWSHLLREVSNSRLLLKGSAFESAEIQEVFLSRFEAAGIDPQRIMFRGSSPHAELLAEYGDIDIALDTFPYNGGLTTLEALWMGTPVITLEGERIISRQSAAILNQLGLTELVAHSAEEFAAIGKFWAQHRGRLEELRKSLRGRLAASSVTDAAAYTRDLERHFEAAWSAYRGGLN